MFFFFVVNDAGIVNDFNNCDVRNNMYVYVCNLIKNMSAIFKTFYTNETKFHKYSVSRNKLLRN